MAKRRTWWRNPALRQAIALTGERGWWLSGSQLDLDFAYDRAFNRSTGFNGSPNSLLTYTSPSPKMVYGDDGVLGYAGHNLALYSSTLTNGSWTKTNGAYSGGKLTENGSTGLHAVSRNVTVTAGRLIVSVRLKAAERSAGRVFIGSTNGFQVNFDLSVPSVSGGAGVGTGVYESAGVIDLGGDEYRVWVAGRAADASSVFYVYMNNGVSVSYTGDGTSGMFINEVQVEFSGKSLPLTYIPTTTAAVYSLPINHDPITHAPLGVLIEEQRTNLLTYAEQFDNAAWLKSNITITANAVTAPDGTTTADKIEATASGATTMRQNKVVAASAATFSIYVKIGSGATAANTFNLYNITTAADLLGISFNYSTGAITYNVGSTGASAVELGDGWWRLILSASSGITSGDTIQVYPCFSGGGETAGEYAYAWGAQLEAGSFATSYIPTVASQVTRAADQVSILTSAFGYNQLAGTIAVDAILDNRLSSSAAGFRLCELSNGAANRVIDLYTVTAAGLLQWYNGTAITNAGTPTIDPNKVAVAYATSNYASSLNGAAVVSSASVLVNTATTLYVGRYSTGIGQINGHIKRLTYWNTRKTDAELQELTS